jgi:hypothetical protein
MDYVTYKYSDSSANRYITVQISRDSFGGDVYLLVIVGYTNTGTQVFNEDELVGNVASKCNMIAEAATESTNSPLSNSNACSGSTDRCNGSGGTAYISL